MYALLIIILVCLLLGLFPGIGLHHGYGYYPSGGLGLVVVILIVLLLLGRI